MPTSRTARFLAPAVLAAALLTGCGSPTAAAPPEAGVQSSSGRLAPTDALDLAAREGTVVVDVRTPEEFAADHLAGAVNVDVQATDFDQRVGELDPAGTYVVYCRSGARSAAAVERMAGLGFTDLHDAGALSDLLAAGGTPG